MGCAKNFLHAAALTGSAAAGAAARAAGMERQALGDAMVRAPVLVRLPPDLFLRSLLPRSYPNANRKMQTLDFIGLFA